MPQTRAVVINLRTTIGPSNKVFNHEVVIANGKARSLEELDRWRLFDLTSGSVTYVDDLAKTYRNENLTPVIASHATSNEAEKSKLVATGLRKNVNGVDGVQYVLTRGAYRRELWLASLPNVPAQLFALMQASRRPTGENSPRWTESALVSLRGYPVDDHAQLPYGASEMSIDQTVVSVEEKDVPAALLVLPGRYRDVTVTSAPKAPAARPPASSSPPPGRTTPGAG